MWTIALTMLCKPLFNLEVNDMFSWVSVLKLIQPDGERPSTIVDLHLLLQFVMAWVLCHMHHMSLEWQFVLDLIFFFFFVPCGILLNEGLLFGSEGWLSFGGITAQIWSSGLSFWSLAPLLSVVDASQSIDQHLYWKKLVQASSTCLKSYGKVNSNSKWTVVMMATLSFWCILEEVCIMCGLDSRNMLQ